MTDTPAPLVNATSLTPTRKTSAVMISGASSTAVSVILGWALSKMGLEVPAEVQVAAVSIITAAVAYFTRERQTDQS